MRIYSKNPNGQFKITLKNKICLGCGISFHPISCNRKYHSKLCWIKYHEVWNEGKNLPYIPHLRHRGKLVGNKNPAWKGGIPKCKNCQSQLARRDAIYCQKCANYIYHSGDKNNNWKGGITPLNERERKSPAYRRWHRAILKRDNHQCIWCGTKDNLEVDHIKPFALYPKLRVDINNGRTLCMICHQKTFIFYANQYIKFKEVSLL